MIPRLWVKGGRRRAIPLARLSMARGAKLPIQLFPLLGVGRMSHKRCAKHDCTEDHDEYHLTYTLHCCAPPLLAIGQPASIQALRDTPQGGTGIRVRKVNRRAIGQLVPAIPILTAR